MTLTFLRKENQNAKEGIHNSDASLVKLSIHFSLGQNILVAYLKLFVWIYLGVVLSPL